MSAIEFLTTDKGTTAYKQVVMDSPLGVFLLAGHATTFESRKRQIIEDFGQENNVTTTHFTWYGWDQSHSETVPELGEGYIREWLDQTLHLFDTVTSGPQIIVGSSMGGYLALALAQARPERVKAIVGIAAGFGPGLQQKIKNHYGEYRVCSSTEPGFEFSIHPDNSLPITGQLNIQCPVRLIHSVSDERVSCRNTIHIAQAVQTNDVITHLVKGPGHSDNRPEDALWIKQTLQNLL